MAASALWYDSEGSSEGFDAYALSITWGSWAGTEDAAPPQGLQVQQTSFVALPVSCGCWAHMFADVGVLKVYLIAILSCWRDEERIVVVGCCDAPSLQPPVSRLTIHITLCFLAQPPFCPVPPAAQPPPSKSPG